MKALLLSLFFLLGNSTTKTQTLFIEIDNLKEAKGDMIVSVYAKENEFLGDEVFKFHTIKAEKPVTKTRVELPSGSYAIFVAHDINRDGEVNQNFVGIPTEPIGVSQNKFGGFTKPSFEECAIFLNSDKTIKIKLVHY